MTVNLLTSRTATSGIDFDSWYSITGAPTGLDSKLEETDVPDLLEETFDSVIPQWLEIAYELGQEPTSDLAHTPACVANSSDFGVMLAWSKLVEKWAKQSDKILVLCDDPWLYRQLAALPGVESEKPPLLWPKKIKFALRGYLARTKVAILICLAHLKLKHQRHECRLGEKAVLVYGHPASIGTERDAYFGDLFGKMPELRRLLHVDCPLERAKRLSSDGRTISLHAWGNVWSALNLVKARWKISSKHRSGRNGWLLQRAEALEAGTGQPAMIRWQQVCQKTWLEKNKPAIFVWPWENHAWERQIVRDARKLKIPTIGYLHTPFGDHHIGISVKSNPDGLNSVPDKIICTGPAVSRHLEQIGYLPNHIIVGGGLRETVFKKLPYDPEGPILMALPNHRRMAKQMIGAAVEVSNSKIPILVKTHPMMPAGTVEIPEHITTDLPLASQPKLSSVIFAASSIGLEASIGGIPTIRFRPEGEFATIAAFPETRKNIAANARNLMQVANSVEPVKPLDSADYFMPPDFELWKDLVSVR